MKIIHYIPLIAYLHLISGWLVMTSHSRNNELHEWERELLAGHRWFRASGAAYKRHEFFVYII